MQLYPLKFIPNFHSKLWGGRRLRQFKGQIPMGEIIGESWEVSVAPNGTSRVANGELRDQLLTNVVKEFGEQILGADVAKRYGNKFPLLIKFIDAAKDLSIQVHPNDEIANSLHNSLGKTEMWYVIDATDDACIISGLKEKISKEQFESAIKDNTITDYLCKYKAKKGDVFYVPAGRVHAICSGCLLAEIQQNSDITYRIFDYDRTDLNGLKRTLHIDEAIKAVDFATIEKDYHTYYKLEEQAESPLVDSEFFKTSIISISEPYHHRLQAKKSFTILICTEGHAFITDNNQHKISLKTGDTTLIPAEIESIDIKPLMHTTLLCVHL